MAGDPKLLYLLNGNERRQQLPGSSFPHSPLLDNSTPMGVPREGKRKLEGEAALGLEVRPVDSGLQPGEANP